MHTPKRFLFPFTYVRLMIPVRDGTPLSCMTQLVTCFGSILALPAVHAQRVDHDRGIATLILIAIESSKDFFAIYRKQRNSLRCYSYGQK